MRNRDSEDYAEIVKKSSIWKFWQKCEHISVSFLLSLSDRKNFQLSITFYSSRVSLDSLFECCMRCCISVEPKDQMPKKLNRWSKIEVGKVWVFLLIQIFSLIFYCVIFRKGDYYELTFVPLIECTSAVTEFQLLHLPMFFTWIFNICCKDSVNLILFDLDNEIIMLLLIFMKN